MWTRILPRALAIVATCAGLHHANPEFRITSPSARYRYQVLTATVAAILLATSAPRRTWCGFALAALTVRVMHLADQHAAMSRIPFPMFWTPPSKSMSYDSLWNGCHYPEEGES